MIRAPRLAAGIVLLLAILGMASTAAFAYWTSAGQGTGFATTATLDPPGAPSATVNPGLASVELTWTPAGGLAPEGYYLLRTRQSDGATAAACDTSATQLTASSSCTDADVPAGTYRYAVVAVFRSWSATSAVGGPIAVTPDTAPPLVTVTRVNGVSVSFPFTSAGVTSIGGTCGTEPGDIPEVHPLIDGAATTPSTVPCASGSWTLTLGTPLSSGGTRTLSATQSDLAGNPGQAPPATLVIDATAPTVVSIARVGAATRNAGPLEWTVTFSEPVSGVGNANFALDRGTGIGGTIPTFAAIAPATGPSTTWTIRANTTGTTGTGSATSTIRLDLTSGTGITDAAGNALASALPLQGQAFSYDTLAPTLQSITRTGAAALVNSGPISWSVTFSEPVSGVDTGDLALVSSAVTPAPSITSITPTSGPSATWTVTSSLAGASASNGSIRLDLVSGASITDAGGNALTGAAATGPAYGYDTVAPVVATAATAPPGPGVTSPTANGSYRAGQSIAVTVPFTEAVTVTGSPALALVTGPGSTTTAVGLTAGTGTSLLTFGYTIAAGDTSNDLRYQATGSLTGGTITDLAGNPAVRTLPAPGAAGSLDANKQLVVDTTAPIVAITSVNGSTTVPYRTNGSITSIAGTCGTVLGDLAPITVVVTGGTSTTSSAATCSSGAWSMNPNLTTNGTYSVTATQADGAGNTGASGPRTFEIDTVPPALTSFERAGSSDTVNAGPLDWTLTFSEPVSNVVPARFSLTRVTAGTAPIISSATPVGGAPSATWTVRVTTNGTTGTNTGSIRLNLATKTGITDASGNLLSTAVPANGPAYTYDTTAPTVSVAAGGVSSPLANGSYGLGQVIPITVAFSEAVTVTGTPQLALATGTPASSPVDYTSGSGSSTLTFTYTVAAGNASADLTYTGTAALTLAGGTVTDAAGNAAVLTLPGTGATGSLGTNKALVIDAAPPVVTVTSITRQTFLFWRQVRVSGTAETGAGPVTVYLCATATCGPDTETQTFTVAVGTTGTWTTDWSGWAVPGTWYATATQTDALGNVGTSATFGPYSS
jgi:hypothetical protein